MDKYIQDALSENDDGYYLIFKRDKLQFNHLKRETRHCGGNHRIVLAAFDAQKYIRFSFRKV